MTPWRILRTERFLKALRKHRHNGELLKALDKKVKRLEEDPKSVGGMRSGECHGSQSTRLVSTFRLVFSVYAKPHRVCLEASITAKAFTTEPRRLPMWTVTSRPQP
ncbi:MAG: hypothetical protein HS102_07620 [Planctomycetia bacterium]|nr:hypothetical protein [Planctomycetia bacterium]